MRIDTTRCYQMNPEVYVDIVHCLVP